MPLIEVKNLRKSYSNEEIDVEILHGLTFNIEKGEFVAIMGPSGSGKSTLLHILGFLDRHSSGEYRFEGKTIDEYSDEILAKIRNKNLGFIFQAFNLLSRVSVLENVKLPTVYSDIKGKKREELARKAIEAVGLSHRVEHTSSQLSGGEKQRVAIARALVSDPEVIFADEPTGNLDSKSGQAVMEILQRLNKEGKHTIILITHDEHIASYAHRLIKIRDGNIESDRKT